MVEEVEFEAEVNVFLLFIKKVTQKGEEQNMNSVMELKELSSNELVTVMNEVMAEVKSRLVDGTVSKYVGREKMVSLNEIASLVKQIQSLMAASDNDILIADIDTCNTHVQMKHIAFLVEFIEYEIRFIEDAQYPYELSSTINGVKFFAFMDARRIVGLKTTIPDQFDYITVKVQVEGV